MRKWHVVVVFLSLFAMGYMAAGGIQGNAEEAPAYGEESPGYGEESPGYGEETAGYGEEEGLGEQPPVLALPSGRAPTTTTPATTIHFRVTDMDESPTSHASAGGHMRFYHRGACRAHISHRMVDRFLGGTWAKPK